MNWWWSTMRRRRWSSRDTCATWRIAVHATLIEQPVHQGYAAALNRAFALHRDRDVVVLQSDAEVANDWLDRLIPRGDAAGNWRHRYVYPETRGARRIRFHAAITRCRRE
jgi:hypothetical protein